MITSRLKLSDLQDPTKLDKFLSQFSALYDIDNYSPANDPSSVLNLFQSSSDSSSSSNGILSLFETSASSSSILSLFSSTDSTTSTASSNISQLFS